MTGTLSATPRKIWTLTFLNVIFISLASTGIVDALQAALPVFIAQSGGSSTLGGVTVAAFALAAIFPSLVAGTLADSFGCRRVMLWGAGIFLAGCAGTLVFTGVLSLLVFRIVQGVGFAVVSVCSAAGASNILPKERLGEGLGYFGLGQSLAMALGPMAGLWLVSRGAETMWTAISVVAFFILLMSFFCKCDRKNSANEATRERPKFSFRNIIEKRALLPALMILIICTGFCSLIVFSGLYAKLKGFGNAGVFFVIASAGMLAVRFSSRLFMDKFRTLQILIPTMFLGLFAFVLPAYFQSQIAFYFSGAFFGVSFGVAMPLLSALAVKRTPPERWGSANATFYLCLNLGFGSGAFFGGMAIDFLGFENALFSGTLTVIVPVLLGVCFLRKE